MTGIDPDALECRRRWAAEQLSLAPDASTGDIRQCWLRRLGDEAFVPSAELRWALAVMLQRRPGGGWEKRVDEIALREEQERLRGAVETFAQDFWDLEPGDRRQHWQTLLAACAPVPSLQARLRLLEAGLGPVPFPAAGAPERVLKLAHAVRRLFVLRPEPRARARQAFLARTAGDSKNWQAAARRLRHTCPALAALGSDLLDKVGAALPVSKAPRYAPAKTPAPEIESARWPKLLIWLGVIFAVRILVGITSPSKDVPPRGSFPAPSFPASQMPDRWPETKDNKKNPPQEWERDKTGAPAGEKLNKLLEDIAKEHPEWKVPPQNGQPEAEKKAKDNKSP